MASSDADSSGRARRVGLVVLAAGIALLILGIVVAVVRHNRASDAAAAELDVQRERYEVLLRKAAAQAPRAEVLYVEMSLADYRRLTRGRAGVGRTYAVVQTPVAERLKTNRPPVRPNFGTMEHEPYFDAFARAFRERRAHEKRLSVVALLVTLASHARIARLRLEGDRIELRGPLSVWDPGVVIEDRPAGSSVRSERADVVTWKPAERVSALIPLYLVHLFVFENVSANADLLRATSGALGWNVTSNTLLYPRRLFVDRADGRQVAIPITEALASPLVLDVAGG